MLGSHIISLMKPLSDSRRWPRKAGFGAAILAGGALAGVVSVALLARIAVPHAAGLLATALPRVRASVRAWFVPPYLFVTVHLIIVIIWKLSEHKAHGIHRPEEEKSPPEAPLPAKPVDLARKPSSEVLDGIPTASGEYPAPTPDLDSKSGGSAPDPSSDWSCLTTESEEMSTTASSRLEIKRSIKLPMPSVEREKEEEEEDDDSMEAMWKAIAAGGAAPVVRFAPPEVEAAPPPAGGAMGRGLPSEPEHEEWNRRFDAFIRRNYEQIRLQREQSQLNSAMVNRA